MDTLDEVRSMLPGEGPAFLESIQAKREFLRDGHAAGVAAAEAPVEAAGLLMAGMGFSGLAADLVTDAVAGVLEVPWTTVKHYRLPRHVTRRWHTMAISYSGQTEETLRLVAQARERGSAVTAFTCGGRLASEADVVVPQPSGYQPRAACGFTWFSILGHLHRVGLLGEEVPIDAAVAAVAEVDAACGPDIPEDRNAAKRLARRLVDPIPQVYATPAFLAIGQHFRGMLNECAKKIADVDLVPECNHNDLTGWSGDTGHRGDFMVLALSHGAQDPQIQRRLAYMEERYTQWGVPWHSHVLPPVRNFGEHVVAQTRAMQFLDYTSVYVAALRGVDPSDIHEIKALKARLAV